MKTQILRLVMVAGLLLGVGCATTGSNQIQGTVQTPPVEYVK